MKTKVNVLYDLFGRYGKVFEVRYKGKFAFVEMNRHEDAGEAIKGLDGTRVNGRRIIVEWSRDYRRSSSYDPQNNRSRSYERSRTYDSRRNERSRSYEPRMEEREYSRSFERRNERSRSFSPVSQTSIISSRNIDVSDTNEKERQQIQYLENEIINRDEKLKKLENENRELKLELRLKNQRITDSSGLQNRLDNILNEVTEKNEMIENLQKKVLVEMSKKHVTSPGSTSETITIVPPPEIYNLLEEKDRTIYNLERFIMRSQVDSSTVPPPIPYHKIPLQEKREGNRRIKIVRKKKKKKNKEENNNNLQNIAKERIEKKKMKSKSPHPTTKKRKRKQEPNEPEDEILKLQQRKRKKRKLSSVSTSTSSTTRKKKKPVKSSGKNDDGSDKYDEEEGEKKLSLKESRKKKKNLILNLKLRMMKKKQNSLKK